MTQRTIVLSGGPLNAQAVMVKEGTMTIIKEVSGQGTAFYDGQTGLFARMVQSTGSKTDTRPLEAERDVV